MDFDLFIIYKKREPILVTGYKYATSYLLLNLKLKEKNGKDNLQYAFFTAYIFSPISLACKFKFCS